MSSQPKAEMKLAWIVVSDLAKAKQYFTDVVGLQLLANDENYGWAELGQPNGGFRLGLAQKSPYNPMPPGSNAVMTFTVPNLEKSKAEMAKKGMKFIGEVMEVPDEVKLQTFEDPDGNQFQLVETLRPESKF